MSNQKFGLSDTPTPPPRDSHHHDQQAVNKASSISESQEEGTITDEGRYPNSGYGNVFVGNGDFGEIERDDINVEGKVLSWSNPIWERTCITVYFLYIIAAIDEFHELQKELSHISRRSSGMAPEKLEQGEASENDFNLSNFLHGMSDDRREAGHQLKHLGVIWKDLTVEVCDTEKAWYF